MKFLVLIVLMLLAAVGCAHNMSVEDSTGALLNPALVGDEELYEVTVSQVVMDHSDLRRVTPVIVLVNKDNDEELLPILVGFSEGLSINMVLSKSVPERPWTHDLFSDVLGQFHIELVKVVITDLRRNTYIATMTVELNGEEKQIDARPSDAIALALRCVAPIFISGKVVRKGGWTKPLKQGEKQQEKPRRRREEMKEEKNLL